MTTKEINAVLQHMQSEYGDRAETSSKFFHKDLKTVPIFSRKSISPLKQDSMVNVHSDFMTSIIEQKIGYMGDINIYFQQEIESQLFDSAQFWLQRVNASNQYEIKTPESIRWTSVEGVSHRLLYLRNGEPRVKNLHGWQVAYSYEDDIFHPDKAFVFFDEVDLSGNILHRLNIYDSTFVEYYYLFNNGWKSYVVDGASRAVHMFSEVPVVVVLNNESMIGDCSINTLKNINVFDEVQSDILSEIKASRNAYLKIFGDIFTGYLTDKDGEFILDSEGKKIPIEVPSYIREFGTLLFGTGEDGKRLGDAEFLTKTIDDSVVEHNLDRLRQQIYHDSGAVDERDITMGANTRVIGIKAAFARLERKCFTFSKYYNVMLRRQYELLLDCASRKLLEGFSISENDKWLLLENLEIEYDYNELIDPIDNSRTHEVNMKTMSFRDAFALNPQTSHDPEGFAERYIEQLNSELTSGFEV